MKVGIFNTLRGGVERFQPYADKYGGDIELVALGCPPSIENMETVKKLGCEALIYTAQHKESEEFFKAIADAGVKYVCCCCAGYDHFNIPAMKKYGLKGANVPVYSPNSVAEHTVLLTLALLRKLREQVLRVENRQYSPLGLMGREMRNMKFGVVGAGRIGFTSIKCLSGFEPRKIYACDPHENEAVKGYAEYVSLDRIYEECDVILYHCMLNDSNYHMVNEAAIAKMKDGVVLVNAARGGLFDRKAVLRAVESGKIGGLGMDVIEGEELLKKQPQYDECPIPELKEMLTHKNVIFTSHTAFFTDEAEKNLNETTIENLASYARTGMCDKELVIK